MTTTYRRAPVQAEYGESGKAIRPAGTIAWSEHLQVWDAYALRYGQSQSPERIAARGGFGYSEAEMLLGHALFTWEPQA